MAKKTRSNTTSSKSAPTFAGIQRGVVGNDFNPDYSQTIKDLKRIGLLAGIFFGVLIALGFILP